MTQYTWETCPGAVRRQIGTLVGNVREVIGGNLVGIYLHGSLSMGCFNPARSDIDILIATHEPLPAPVRRRVIDLMLRLSAAPAPIEMSVLTRGDLHPWRYPPPFDLHFGESWRERYRSPAMGEAAWQAAGDRPTDIDLAAHITHLRDRGIVLLGPPIADVFPPVPDADYRASILADYRDAWSAIDRNPAYAVLNVLRVYRYLLEGRLSSKEEAGSWALGVVPAEVVPVVRSALEWYRGEVADGPMRQEGVPEFVAAMDAWLEPLLATETRDSRQVTQRSGGSP